MTDVFDTLLKFIIIGDAAVGKSAILHRFIENQIRNEGHTIGVEFGSKIVEVGGKRIKLSGTPPVKSAFVAEDVTAGRSVTRSYYRGAAGVLLVYDISNRDTFHHVTTWLNDARTLANAEAVIILVGNKADLADEREVTFLEASRYAQENDLIFLETSAYTGDNVEEVFLKCTRSILTKMAASGQAPPGAAGSSLVGGSMPEASASSCAC